MNKINYYVLFPNVESGQALYRLVKQAGINATMAPTPRKASKCCGIAILYYDPADTFRIKKLAEINQCAVSDFYQENEDHDPNRMRFC